MECTSKQKKTFLIIFISLLLFNVLFLTNSVAAEKVTIEQTNGILISDANQKIIERGVNHTFDFHLSRLDDGTLINDTNTICEFALYDKNGELLINDNLNFDSTTTSNWDVEISGEHFERLGIYTYIVQCEDEVGKIGGVRALEVEVKTRQLEYDLPQVVLMIFVFLLLMALLIMSYRLGKSKDESKKDFSKLARLKQTNSFDYYFALMKTNFYIIGYFGVYLSLFILIALLNDVLYSLNLTEVSEITQNLTIILGYGFIPFIIFWMGWFIITFYKTAENVFKYQFGGFKK